MTTKPYLYKGPRPSGVTLAGDREVPLHPGRECALPPDNPYVKTLVALGHLQEIAPEAPEVPTPEPTKKEKGGKP